MGVDDFFCSQRHQGMALVLFLGCDARARLERVRKARALVRVTARHRAFDRARSSNDFTLCVSITNHLVALHAARERGGAPSRAPASRSGFDDPTSTPPSPEDANGFDASCTYTTCSGAVDTAGRRANVSPMIDVVGYPAALSAAAHVSAASAGTLARRPPAVCGSNIRGYIAFLAIASWFATARANRTFDACSEDVIPRSKHSRAPSSTGTASRSSTAATFEPLHISTR
eukprot:30937-Pelagococcus_subviridis.AAC.21